MIGSPPRTERGLGTVVTVGVMAVLLALGVTGACIAGYLLAAQRVRTAADLAALSGATAYAKGADPCAAARRNARGNNAVVVSCSQVGDLVDFVVTIRAEVRVRVRLPGLPTRSTAVAHAGSTAS